VTELAVALDEPGADVFMLTRLLYSMGEWTGRACCTCANLKELAGYVREIFRL